MSFNLKEELLKLSNTAPALKDSDDELGYDLTKAKVDLKSNGEFNDDMNIDSFDNRRIRASIGGLDDYGKRYKGKKITRNQVIDQLENEEDVDSDEIDLHLSAEEDEEVDEEEVDEDEDEDEGGSESEKDLEEVPKAKKLKTASGEQESLSIMNNNMSEEVEKGKAVHSQLGFWEFLLETRVKLQNVLSVVNQFPQHDNFENVLDELQPEDLKKNTVDILNENKKTLVKLMNQSIELQQLMFTTEKDTKCLVDSVNEDKHLKKGGSEGSESELEEDEDDEEIFSDTDEEFQANQNKKKPAKSTKSSLKGVTIKHFKPELIEAHLDKVNRNFFKYKNAIIQKWYDKTRLTSGKSFESFEKPILQQIEHILADRDRLVKRTQLKRTVFKICGKQEKLVSSLEELNNRHVSDYDPEIFDDQDFYNQLMRELIDRKTSNVVDPVELSRKSIELQKLRSKNKKVVDTKASKGRKIKFNVHKPMVNFMAPIYRNQMPEEGRNELFRSLFGNHITLSTSNSEANLKAKGNNTNVVDLGFQDLFKKL